MKTLQIGMGWFPEEPGGVSRYYYNSTKHLADLGVSSQGLVTGSQQIASKNRNSIQAFAPSQASLLNRWRGLRAAVQALDLTEYDLGVVHFSLYGLPLMDLWRKLPLVCHFHGPWALESMAEKELQLSVWVKKALEQTIYNQASRFIVLSQAFQEILHREYSIPLEKIHIIPGGVDLEQFQVSQTPEQARQELGWEQDRPTIFCVRRLARRMGLENLITAIASIKPKYPEILLYIAGKGALEASLQQQIRDLDLTDNVRLLGYLPDEQLPLAYCGADFSVIPSTAFEGFGLIAIESLAVGTPVLATPVGGLPEILEPFCPDLLFESTSPKHLAAGILEVLSHQRQLPTAQACQAYVRENYSWSAIAPKIKAVYEKV